MDNYLIAKDLSTYYNKPLSSTKTVIEPILFECADSLKSGNDLILKIPYNASDDLNVGDFVYSPDSDTLIGGQLLSKEIDRKQGIVTYKGLSARGMLSVPLHTQTKYQYNGYSDPLTRFNFYDPEGDHASYYTEGHTSLNRYIQYNIVKALTTINSDAWNLPVTFYENNYIPQATFADLCDMHYSNFYNITFPITLGESFHDIMYKYYVNTHQKAKIKYHHTNGIAGLMRVYFTPREQQYYTITDEAVTYCESLATNMFVAEGGSIAFINTSNKAATSDTISGANNRKYNGFMIRDEYIGSDDVSDYRISLLANQSPLEMTIDNLDSSKLSGDVGDVVKFIDADYNFEISEVITEKLYTIENGETKITYSLGG